MGGQYQGAFQQMQEELTNQVALAHHTTGQVHTAAVAEVARLRNELAKTQGGHERHSRQQGKDSDSDASVEDDEGTSVPIEHAADDSTGVQGAVAGSSADVDMDDSGAEEVAEKKKKMTTALIRISPIGK